MPNSLEKPKVVDSVVEELANAGFQNPTAPPTNWVGSVLPAALWAVDPTLEFANKIAAESIGLEAAKSVVVIMVDGLGVFPLRDRMSYAKTLRQLGASMSSGQSTVPSTTASALSAFGTGALPSETQMVGYSVRRSDRVMNLLNFEPGLDVEDWQRVPTLFERASQLGLTPRVITAPKFRGSGLTRAAFRGAEFVGRESLEERFGAALKGIRSGAALQVVYWADIDHTGHKYGAHSQEWARALEEFDTELGVFLSRVPSDTVVVLTADHGMVDVERIIDIASVPALSEGVLLIAGEGRAVHLHAQPGAEDKVVRRWSDYLGDQADVVRTAELSQLMGDGRGLSQVGAAMVFAKGRTVILDSRTQSPGVFQMVGVHGSLTREEMTIPIWRLV